MKRLGFFIWIGFALLGIHDSAKPGWCAVAGELKETTPAAQGLRPESPAQPVDGAVQHGAMPVDAETTSLIYMSSEARITFLFLIFLFVGVYFLIRRRPTDRSIRKKQKRKF